MLNQKNEDNSVYVTKYLKKIFVDANKKNEIVDFFVETYFGMQDFASSGMINNIQKEFYTCSANIDDNIRERCYQTYKKMRYHYGDIRRYIALNPHITSPKLHELNEILNKFLLKSYSILSICSLIQKVFRKYKLDPNYVNKLIDGICNVPKIKKNLKNIQQNYGNEFGKLFVNKLKQFYRNICIQEFKKLEISFNALNNMGGTCTEFAIDENYEARMSIINNVAITFLNLTIGYMDIYMLGRIFKKFLKNTKTKHSNIHQDYATKIIIVAGAWHTLNYASFLEQFNYKIIFNQDINEKTNCVDVSKIPKSLFSGGYFDEKTYNPYLSHLTRPIRQYLD